MSEHDEQKPQVAEAEQKPQVAETGSPRDYDKLVGSTVAGRFEVIDRIAVGGMGSVYRANQVGLEREVALKILKRELAWDPKTVARFDREAKATSQLVHPNTIRVFDFGRTEEDRLYFAMELLKGELLSHKLDREGAMDPQEAIRIAQQILRSLSEAHSKGIIHRDLKPDNIFLARVGGHPEPVVKVLDFGIAKIVEGDRTVNQLETQAGTVFGTPRYMSPEQAQGRKLDARSDLYSVGILLYQMLTGRAPFRDEDAVVVMARHIRERPERPRLVVPERPIPAVLDQAVMRAVSKDARKRFESAEAFCEALEAALEPAAALARATEPSGSGWFASVPRMALATGSAIVAAATALSIYVATAPLPESELNSLPSAAAQTQ